MLQAKIVKKIKTNVLSSVTFSELRVVYEVMWKNMVKLEMTRHNMAHEVTCWIIKATHTLSNYNT